MVSDIDIGDSIRAKDLKHAYERKFSIDVARFFPVNLVTLDKVLPFGYYIFRPTIPGDSQFYSDLMNRIAYDDGNKAEFLAAKEYVSGNEQVLDVGSGPGRFSAFCNGSYKGVELNPEAVAEARRHGRNVVLEKLEDQPVAAFDVVTLFQVLEHVSEPEAFLAEAARRVAPGGRLIVSTPDMAGYMASSTNHVLNYPPHHMSWWTGDSLAALMASNQLTAHAIWKEPLQQLHVTDWVESTLFPRRSKHFDFSAVAKAKRAIAKLGSLVATPFLRRAPHVTGQCVMVVGQRAA